MLKQLDTKIDNKMKSSKSKLTKINQTPVNVPLVVLAQSNCYDLAEHGSAQVLLFPDRKRKKNQKCKRMREEETLF